MWDKDTLLGDILADSPDMSEVLLGLGMHCTSCSVSRMETLEEACKVHNLPVDPVVNFLNEEAEKLGI
ncbi:MULTISPECIES: DUF1858 domain-containing protein [Shuttleworthella]|uniref:Hydrid cluster protein-associated redox disulfide domain protein n=1 Tax=Shuttleworthella satelles DSM 14600 TaxID=626523 RepID=C4GBS4_9FIRM|nr:MULTISPECIES: DUF1858 domain-containing protein [Shuttleworthia]EEP28568.1 hydrid cluster protein-associated redox disulfide domain protein [Shuttleworthia satelles DSM 14600]EUB14634.1 PF08984 domain protein [Shuttleworthia sp. MSX8B]